MSQVGQFRIIDVVTSPPDSSTVTAAFGGITVGVAKQSSLTYDVILNIQAVVVAAAFGAINLGVSPTNPPNVNSVLSGITTLSSTYSFSAYVPAGYYILITSSGIASVSLNVQAMAV